MISKINTSDQSPRLTFEKENNRLKVVQVN